MDISSYARILAILIVGIVEAKAEGSNSPILQISQGKLQGSVETSRNGRNYSSFKGIPYGKASRFEDSTSADDWKGIRDASKFREDCLQISVVYPIGEIIGVEDCLFLNIYTPKASNESNLPVMVFIHGGGWQFGSGKWATGNYFMDEDVVLVSINYRVGPFGFTNTGDFANFGLKDQITALKWIQQNIQAFGGNPNSVTIFGESAGAGSVSFLILSPLAKDLFHRGIAQSGMSNSPFATVSDPERELRKLGILMDCPISNKEYLVQCLKRIDGNYMLKRLQSVENIAKQSGGKKEFQEEDVPKFLASIDLNSKSSFLPDTPINLMKKGEFAKVPLVTGVNELEGLLFPRSPELKNTSHLIWNPKDAKAMAYDENDSQGLARIREFYIGNKTEEEILNENVTNLFSDRFFGHPAKVGAVLHAKHAPTYLYYFSLKGNSAFIGQLNPPGPDGLIRPGHADELQYLFDMDPIFPTIKSDSTYAPFSQFLVKLWASFAKDGTMSPEKLSSTAKEWKPLDSAAAGELNANVEWYQIDQESKSVQESSIFESRLNFWNDLNSANNS